MSAKRAKYHDGECEMTLREGIKELRDREGPQGDVTQRMSPDMETVMRAHDAVHVVFGCSTSLEDEALAHFVMIFGTTVKFSDMRKVAKTKDHRNVVGEHSKWQIASVVAGAVPDLIRVLKLTSRMKKKWPWFGFEEHLDRPLRELRQEFGIRAL